MDDKRDSREQQGDRPVPPREGPSEPGESQDSGGYSHASGIAPQTGERDVPRTARPATGEGADRREIGYTEPVEPVGGVDEDDLRVRLNPRPPVEDPLSTPSGGVERQSVSSEEDLPEREGLRAEERTTGADIERESV